MLYAYDVADVVERKISKTQSLSSKVYLLVREIQFTRDTHQALESINWK